MAADRIVAKPATAYTCPTCDAAPSVGCSNHRGEPLRHAHIARRQTAASAFRVASRARHQTTQTSSQEN